MKPLYLSAISMAMMVLLACSNEQPSSNAGGTEQTQNVNTTEDHGKKTYESTCAPCHGLDGTAGIAGAANLKLSRLDSPSVVQIIHNGKNAMPAFSHQLTDPEIHELVSYVYTLRQ